MTSQERSETTAKLEHPHREVQYTHSRDFVAILRHLGGSLLISTYAAGKVVAVGTDHDGLTIDLTNFSKAMGIAVATDRLAVCTRDVIWMLQDAGDLSRSIDPIGQLDRAFLARTAFYTGDIAGHEMAFGGDGQLWIVNTLFSCLCTTSGQFSFVPRWRPPFISQLAPQDRCHLNGMAFDPAANEGRGHPVAVTAIAATDGPRQWRDHKSGGGVVIDVATGRTIADGLCMPHSPRVHRSHPGKLFVLDSGRGQLKSIDRTTGEVRLIADYPGYGRGLAITDQFAIVGMSRARETSVFGGVPICDDPAAMRCGVVIVEIDSGRSVAYLQFNAGVDELFDVQFLPDSRRPALIGPQSKVDGREPVWVLPGNDDRGS